MTVQEQHIDFKRKLNKVDSQNYRNFRPEEIDLYLNEGQDLFIKKRIGINNVYQTGFETTQKRIEDLRDIHVKWEEANIIPLVTAVDSTKFKFDLTDLDPDYLYLTRVSFLATKAGCDNRVISGIKVETDDLNSVLGSEFYSPSFEWEEVPYVYTGDFIYVYTDGTFAISELQIDYIKRPRRIVNASAVIQTDLGTFPSGFGYLDPNGLALLADVDCELQSMYATSEIVDEAVRLAMIDLGDQRFQLSDLKTKINE